MIPNFPSDIVIKNPRSEKMIEVKKKSAKPKEKDHKNKMIRQVAE